MVAPYWSLMAPKTTLKILAYISTLPLLGAMLMSLNGRFWTWGLSGEMLSFTRLNAYIYAHGYGALLLCLMAGMQLSESFGKKVHSLRLLLYFSLLPLSWFSFTAYADFEGVLMLLCCWIGLFLLTVSDNNHLHEPQSLSRLLVKPMGAVITLLTTLLIINH